MFAVRPAEQRDAEGAVDVVRRSITASCAADHRGDSDTLARWLANKTVRHFVSWLANEDNYCVVAEAHGSPESHRSLLGVGLLQRSGQIILFYLAPNAQRQGIGKAIHAALEEKARIWGLPKLSLDSTLLACPFYERLGYRAAGAARPRFGVLCSYPYEKTLQTSERD